MATSFTTHSAGQVILASAINLIQTAVNALENTPVGVVPTDGSGAVKRSATSFATMSPSIATSTVSFTAGQVYFTFFTAPLSLTTTQVRYAVTTAAVTSAAGTAIGLYSVDGADAGTLIASVASTSLFTTLGAVTKSWAVSTAITAGNRYAIGFLDIVGNTQPQLAGAPLGNTQLVNLNMEYNLLPRITGVWTQATMPASFTAANLNSSNPQNPIYAVLL